MTPETKREKNLNIDTGNMKFDFSAVPSPYRSCTGVARVLPMGCWWMATLVLYYQHIGISTSYEFNEAWGLNDWKKDEQWSIYETYLETCSRRL